MKPERYPWNRITANISLSSVLVLLSSIIISLPAMASSWGNLEIGMGAVMPEGTFRHYSSDGFTGTVKIVFTPFVPRTIGLVGALTGNLFEQETDERFIGGYGFAELKTTHFSVNGNFGIRLQTEKNLFRPYGEITGGLYSFNITTSLEDGHGNSLEGRTGESQLLMGYNVSGGAALWFWTNVGLDFNIKYDNVFDLKQDIGAGQTALFNSHFTSVYFGLQLAFDSTLD
jgi:hypothetical protein